MLRVVGGSARGKKLEMVPGKSTRPILDRVKTSLFDLLRPRITGTRVLDLFAGSGSVGIEALSQGASHCTFIDLTTRAIVTIRKNLSITGLADRAEVRQANALEYLKKTEESFDLIYVAPPQYRELWIETMTLIAARPRLLRGAEAEPVPGAEPQSELDHGADPGTWGDPLPGLAIVQIDPREYRPLDLGVIAETQQRRYGNSLLIFYENSAGLTPGAGEPPPEDPGASEP